MQEYKEALDLIQANILATDIAQHLRDMKAITEMATGKVLDCLIFPFLFSCVFSLLISKCSPAGFDPSITSPFLPPSYFPSPFLNLPIFLTLQLLFSFSFLNLPCSPNGINPQSFPFSVLFPFSIPQSSMLYCMLGSTLDPSNQSFPPQLKLFPFSLLALPACSPVGFDPSDPRHHHLLCSLIMTSCDLSATCKDWESTKAISVCW